MSDEKIDVGAIIGPVLGLVQGSIAPETSFGLGSPGQCWQHHPRVLQLERRVVCSKCGTALDPFDVLVTIAHNEASQRHAAAEYRKHKQELEAMLAEEKRVKARTKNAARKDAQAAVDAERGRTLEARRRCLDKANEAIRLVGEIKRALGADFDEGK